MWQSPCYVQRFVKFQEIAFSVCSCEDQILSPYEYKVDGEGHHLKNINEQTSLFSNASLALIASLSAVCVFLLLCVVSLNSIRSFCRLVSRFLISIALFINSFTSLQLYLVRRVLILRKRPRIKRQFIGKQPPMNPTPLTDRPTPASDICEISIENCCNMNICETVRYRKSATFSLIRIPSYIFNDISNLKISAYGKLISCTIDIVKNSLFSALNDQNCLKMERW